MDQFDSNLNRSESLNLYVLGGTFEKRRKFDEVFGESQIIFMFFYIINQIIFM